MRAVLLLVALLVPSSLAAATITFEQPVLFTGHADFPGAGELTGIRQQFGLGGAVIHWDIPAFDPTLGAATALILQLTTTADVVIAATPPEGVLMVPLFFDDDITQGRYSAHEGGTIHFLPPSVFPSSWHIVLHADSHAFADIGTAGTIDVNITGMATATYVYTPAAAIPEPTTLLLLSGGLLGAAWKRRRRRP